MLGYVVFNAYTLLWILFPAVFSPFYQFMKATMNHIDKKIKKEKAGECEKVYTQCMPLADSAYPFFDVYFDPNSKDMGLLLTLLGSSNGPAEGLRYKK